MVKCMSTDLFPSEARIYFTLFRLRKDFLNLIQKTHTPWLQLAICLHMKIGVLDRVSGESFTPCHQGLNLTSTTL